MGKFKKNWGCGQKYILGSVTPTVDDPKVKILNFMMPKTVRRYILSSFCYDFLKFINKLHFKGLDFTSFNSYAMGTHNGPK